MKIKMTIAFDKFVTVHNVLENAKVLETNSLANFKFIISLLTK